MNSQLLQTVMPLVLSIATPHVAAILNDPRPERRWLRLLIAAVLIFIGAAIELWQSGSWTIEAYFRNVGILFIGSQSVFLFLQKAYLGKLEVLTGNGLGKLLDLGKSGGGGNAIQRLKTLEDLYNNGVITEQEHDARRAQILREV